MTGRPHSSERPAVPSAAPSGHSETIVNVEQVSRRFQVGGEAIWAVRDVSLRLERGVFAALMGRSGSGKTTLLNLIAGLDRPDSGRVYLAGKEITRATERQLLRLRRHEIGFVFQSFGLLPLLSAYENVEVALRIAGAGLQERRVRTTELLQRVDLHARSDHRPYELSGGEQQRVAIARALVNEPSLVVADEPTGELDSGNARAIFDLLRKLAHQSGVTILTATHDRTVLEFADRVEEMADGRLLEHHERDLTAAARDRPSIAGEPAPQESPAGGSGTPVAPAEPAAASQPLTPESTPADAFPLKTAADFRPPPDRRAPGPKD